MEVTQCNTPTHCFNIDVTVFTIAELTSGQIQEATGEAVNNIIKHFHKPEKEASDQAHSEFFCFFTKSLFILWLFIIFLVI